MTKELPASALVLRDIVKQFNGVPALRGASLEVKRGTVHGLIGQNGAGKSTLIKILAGLHAADSGAIAVAGMVGTPTVAVYPPIRDLALQIARWAPWSAPYRAVAAEQDWPDRAASDAAELLRR